MTTTDKDLGWTRIVHELEAANGAVVDTGLFEGEIHPGTEYTVPQIGAVHEFGTKPGTVPVVPERSFLRSTVDEQGSKLEREMDSALDKVLKGRTDMATALTSFGEIAASEVRRKITKGPFEKKAESTIKSQGGGFTKPLIWLGIMRASIRSRIVVDGKKQMTPKG